MSHKSDVGVKWTFEKFNTSLLKGSQPELCEKCRWRSYLESALLIQVYSKKKRVP
jgi:hypothetical protein